MGGWSPEARAKAKELAKLERLDPEVAALRAAAVGTDCADWPALYALAVALVGPLRERPGSRDLNSLHAFDVLHDWLWDRCRWCGKRTCLRCWPWDAPPDRQLVTGRAAAR